MSELFHEFVIWSIGFAVVSSMAMLIGHLIGRRTRRTSTTSDAADGERAAEATRRPAWAATLIVFAVYLLLLGPVLQGVSRAFRHLNADADRSAGPASLSVLATGKLLDDLKSPTQSDVPPQRNDASNCPCRTERRSGTPGISERSEALSDRSPAAPFDVEAASTGQTSNDLPD
jgi:hypothetical protein